ncbi:MAG: cytochrome-c peroxidase [Gammaproteobacteria bacterium]
MQQIMLFGRPFKAAPIKNLPAICAFIVMAVSPVFLSGKAAAHGTTPPSLKGVKVPKTPGLLDGETPIVVNKQAAIRLGKALFWDANVGSDGNACASCHFHAGADRRARNQLSTGSLHKGAATRLTFEPTASGGAGGPNYRLTRSDFPLYQLADPKDRNSAVLFTTDDIVSSAGVFRARFQGGDQQSGNDDCVSKADSIFHLGDLNTRRVQPRHTPSVINAGYNFRNFWDGRANNIFNGETAFGSRDTNAGVWVVQVDGSVRKEQIRLENASLASQATAPPLNDSEMSCARRGFPDIGRKLLPRPPLQFQEVHPQDSVLGGLRDPSGKGLKTVYENLIRNAFAPRYWSGNGDFGSPADPAEAPYTQMEANFAFFFGLALQLYEQTLISDQTPFDTPRKAGIPEGLNVRQRRGLKVFLDAHCANCHKGPTLSAAAHPDIYTAADAYSTLRLVNRVTLNGAFTSSGIVNGIVDEGYFNTSVTPTGNDLGVGGKDPFGNPLSFSMQYLQLLLDNKPMLDPVTVRACDLDNPFWEDYKAGELRPDPNGSQGCGARDIYAKVPKVAVLQEELKKKHQGRALTAVKGAFKVPSLRNVELTGPYMHNGSMLTLEQVVDFYFRGGNFNNPHHFATLVFPQSITDEQKSDLIAFLKALTDERVRWERAPFDHPQLLVPHGHAERAGKDPAQAKDLLLNIPAVGKNGRSALLGPLQPFERYLKP